jgi:hypothetical protein
MVDSESTDGSASYLGCSGDRDHCDWEPKSQRASITLISFCSEQSLASTDPGEESMDRLHKRRYSELNLPDVLQAQGLNKRLERVWVELDETLAPCDLRQLRPKPCSIVLNSGQSSLRMRRKAGLH